MANWRSLDMAAICTSSHWVTQFPQIHLNAAKLEASKACHSLAKKITGTGMITGGALKPKQKESSGLESHWYVTGMPLESLKQIMPVVPLKIHEDTTSRPLVCH